MIKVNNNIFSVFILLCVCFLSACNQKKKRENTDEKAIEISDLSLDKKNIDEAQLAELKSKIAENSANFTTAKIQTDVYYSDISTEQNVQASIQIEKGKRILISLKAFMFTVGKVYITPNRVSYYEILNNTYYDGDFTMISKLLGVSLSYTQVEKLLLGETIVDLDEIHQLKKENNETLVIQRVKDHFVLAQFSEEGGLLGEWVSERKADQDYLVSLQYKGLTDFSGIKLPRKMILATKTKKKVHIEMDYQKIKWNENLKWNFEIPAHYKEVQF